MLFTINVYADKKGKLLAVTEVNEKNSGITVMGVLVPYVKKS